MHNQLILRNATLTDGSVVDVHIDGPVITRVGANEPQSTFDQELDLTGYLLTSSLAEPHAHLDKAFLADRIVNSTGDLMGAIIGLQNIRHTVTHDDIVHRASAAAMLLSQNGVTHVRTHVDVTLDGGLTPLRALMETKALCADFINIQVAALIEWPITGSEGAEHRALARDAISEGIDVIGGCPHLDTNPSEAVAILLQLAADNNLPLDLHADENLRPESNDLEVLADLMLRDGIRLPVNASHCVSLATHSEDDVRRIAQKVAAASISVTALPLTNLFLQERGIHTKASRAIAPLHLLQDEGVLVALGADNLQDPFNLMGRGDPLEVASLAIIAAHLTPINAYNMIAAHSHQVIRAIAPTVAQGQTADLVATRATNVREAIAMGPPDRHVVYGGVVITNQKRNIK
jgi:cytosine deaminase